MKSTIMCFVLLCLTFLMACRSDTVPPDNQNDIPKQEDTETEQDQGGDEQEPGEDASHTPVTPEMPPQVEVPGESGGDMIPWDAPYAIFRVAAITEEKIFLSEHNGDVEYTKVECEVLHVRDSQHRQMLQQQSAIYLPTHALPLVEQGMAVWARISRRSIGGKVLFKVDTYDDVYMLLFPDDRLQLDMDEGALLGCGTFDNIVWTNKLVDQRNSLLSEDPEQNKSWELFPSYHIEDGMPLQDLISFYEMADRWKTDRWEAANAN